MVSLVVADQHSSSVQPLTARSVVLSTLLGFHPPALPVRSLIRVGALFGVGDRAIRTALTRMVSDGDLEADDGTYRLTERLVERQLRQETACSPRTRRWGGRWEVAVITAPPAPLASRVARRRTMAELRLAELREGVWTRPANLRRPLDQGVLDQCEVFSARHAEPDKLARRLWDLDAWSEQAGHLHDALPRCDGLRDGFLLSMAVIRLLLQDPCLPPALLPDDWPGAALRDRYLEFNVTYVSRLREFSDS